MDDKEKIKMLEEQIRLLNEILTLERAKPPMVLKEYVSYPQFIPYVPYVPYTQPNIWTWEGGSTASIVNSDVTSNITLTDFAGNNVSFTEGQ